MSTRTPLAPNLDPLETGIKKVLRSGGLPLRPATAPAELLAIDGVTARSVNPDDHLARVDALDRLLRAEVGRLGIQELRQSARALFGVGTRGGSLTDRRAVAASRMGYSVDHFRKRIEPKIVQQVAWQLHQDSLQYVQRRDDGRPFASSGDTPVITEEHLSGPEVAEREAFVSEIWAAVYSLRAALVRREASSPDTEVSRADQSDLGLTALWRLGVLLVALDDYLDTYGTEILHGAGKFKAEALVRIAGWTGDLTEQQALALRFKVRRQRATAQPESSYLAEQGFDV